MNQYIFSVLRRIAICLSSILISIATFDYKAPAAEIPHGIVALGTRKEIPDSVLQKPFVAGVSLRIGWKEVEPEEGRFEWEKLEKEMDRVERAGKFMTLRVMSGSVSLPDWLFNKVQTIEVEDVNEYHQKTFGKKIRVQVYWDSELLNAKKRLYQEMGKRFGDRRGLKVIGAAFANAYTDDWHLPSGSAKYNKRKAQALWHQAGYTPEKLIQAGKKTIDAAMTAFPNKVVLLAAAEVRFDKDPLGVAREVIRYANEHYPGRLVIQNNRLSARSLSQDEAKGAWKLIAENRPQVAGQMLWCVAGDSTFRMNRKEPGNEQEILRAALKKGQEYGMQYLEVYLKDLEEPKFDSIFKETAEQMNR